MARNKKFCLENVECQVLILEPVLTSPMALGKSYDLYEPLSKIETLIAVWFTGYDEALINDACESPLETIQLKSAVIEV